MGLIRTLRYWWRLWRWWRAMPVIGEYVVTLAPLSDLCTWHEAMQRWRARRPKR